MDLRYSSAEVQFRDELRTWLTRTLPTLPPRPDPRDWPGRRAFDTHWQRLLYDAGYAGIHWPTEHGGRGASPTEHLIFLEETARANAPYVGVNFVGLLHAGPTLIAEATPQQQQEHLPRILRGEEIWCQGFSEPDAGSDLAALRTRAVRDGDHYVVTGRKVWTSHAPVADFCELLVRTDSDAPKHKGITWLIMPMDASGIEIRPLRNVVGSDEFAELILDEVRIPVENRVGDENDGWRVAMVTFSFERGTAFVGEVVESLVLLRDLADLARKGGHWDDTGFRREIGRLTAEFEALWAMTKRNVSEATASGVPGPGASVFKLAFSEARQRISELAAHVLGPAEWSLDDVGGLSTGKYVEERVNTLSYTIAAGASQIQRNIIAERILGLPKDR